MTGRKDSYRKDPPEWKMDMPTVKDTEERRIDISRKRKELTTWELYRYPTKNKPIKSRSKLLEKVDEFFADNEDTPESITPARLALFLGYPSERAMMREINNPNPSDPEYSAILERALALIRDRLLNEMLKNARSQEKDGWKGFMAALDYIDKQDPSMNRKASGDGKGNVNIAIQVNQEQQKGRLSLMINDSVDALLKSTEAETKAIDCDAEEVGDDWQTEH